MPLNTTLITLNPPTLPSGYCPSSWQDLINRAIVNTQAQFNSTIGNSFFNTGSSTPSLDNQIFPWFDQNGEWWTHLSGYWARKHPVPAASSERRLWVGQLADVASYDGGDGTAYSGNNFTGAMWEVDPAFEGKFIVGVGAFSNSGSVSVNGTTTSTGVSGEDKHELIISEMPEHTHQMDSKRVTDVQLFQNAVITMDVLGTTTTPSVVSDGPQYSGENSGSSVAHNNLPPFYGTYVIKRTGRVYYTK